MYQETKYKVFNLRNFRNIPQLKNWNSKILDDMELVAKVLPFKTNNYVVNELINWNDVPNDPMFLLTFPNPRMLSSKHIQTLRALRDEEVDTQTFEMEVHKIRYELNPHPAGQMDHNVPELDGERLKGIQHKYRETVLFFPSAGQTCHAYCSFCFRWPQFVNLDDQKFFMKESERLVDYLQRNPEVQDVLITGGDPMVMSSQRLRKYIEPILEADISHLKTIRIGSKTLSYWPYRYISDKDADDVLQLFEEITEKYHLSFMAHFNHPNELKTNAVQEAVQRILRTGAQIRTQSPILRYINDKSEVLAELWRRQVDMGMIPYYMFIVRDTGAKRFFRVPLVHAWRVFYGAYQNVSGICRTVRGPSMSAMYGKIEVTGVTTFGQEKYIALRFIQARNPKWVGKPFFARYDPHATWIDELTPVNGRKFFFEREGEKYLNPYPDNRQIIELEMINIPDRALDISS